MFQFLKGAIKTRWGAMTNAADYMFQFLKGAIKTWNPVNRTLEFGSFNS